MTLTRQVAAVPVSVRVLQSGLADDITQFGRHLLQNLQKAVKRELDMKIITLTSNCDWKVLTPVAGSTLPYFAIFILRSAAVI